MWIVGSVALLAMGFRLWLGRWVTGAYTDDVMVMTLLREPGRWAAQAPLASAVVEAVRLFAGDPERAGRIASAAAGAACVFPLYALARSIADLSSASWAVLLWAVAPMAVQWQVRPDQQPVHTLAVLVCAWGCLRAAESGRERFVHVAQAGALAAGAARYEGIAWLLPALWCWYRWWRANPEAPRWVAVRPLGWLGAWAWMPLWIAAAPAFEYAQKWSGGYGGRSLVYTMIWALRFLAAYLRDLPVFLTLPLLVVAGVGVWRLARHEERAPRTFLVLAGWAFLVFLSHVLYPFYRSAYLTSAFPFICVFAGIGVAWTGVAVTRPFMRVFPAVARAFAVFLPLVLVADEAIASAWLVKDQGDAMGDIRRLAVRLRALPPEHRIVSDEVPKTRFFANREALALGSTSLQTGDVLAVHSYYTDPRAAERWITNRWDAEEIARETSRMYLRWPDMLPDRGMTHAIDWRAWRHVETRYESTAWLLRKPRRPS